MIQTLMLEMSCRICSSTEKCADVNTRKALTCFDSGDYTQALEIALPLAEKGTIVAQCMVGGLLQVGLGVESDASAAEKWLRSAGEKGCGLAWHNLSSLYLVGGKNLLPNPDEARICRSKAIENGFDLSRDFPEFWRLCYEDLLQ